VMIKKTDFQFRHENFRSVGGDITPEISMN
jgi:hypothetical protein